MPIRRPSRKRLACEFAGQTRPVAAPCEARRQGSSKGGFDAPLALPANSRRTEKKGRTDRRARVSPSLLPGKKGGLGQSLSRPSRAGKRPTRRTAAEPPIRSPTHPGGRDESPASLQANSTCCRALRGSAAGLPAGRAKNGARSLAGCAPFFGLPDRIRTCDLQSRSLTRYPAGLRVDVRF